MTTVAAVTLWGTRVGTVSIQEGARAARFEYDGAFLASGIELAPLTMPLSRRIYEFPNLSEGSFHGLPGLLSDSLPDKFGNAVIDAWLASQGRTEGLNPVERLCYTGRRGMGALEYEPIMGTAATRAERLDVARLAALAEDILARRERFSANEDEGAMAQIIQVGTSAGGARAKAVVAWNEETGEVRSGQVPAGEGFGHWLLKFDGVASNADKDGADCPSYTRIEYAYHLMARAAGVEMSDCRLYEEGGRAHFMTRRFDRIAGGGKLHMQTLAALAHYDFNVPGAHGYEQVAGVIRRLGLGQEAVERLFRRMAFNVAARNQDDHVKNISFLMDKRGAWSLAPAYDVTYAYKPGSPWVGGHQMTVNGKRDGFSVDDLTACACAMDVRPARMRRIMGEVCAAVSSWREFAELAGVRECDAERIAAVHRLNVLG